MNIYNNSTSDGANLNQYYDEGTENQKFVLKESNKAFIIIPGLGGSVLQMGENYPYYNQFINKEIFSEVQIEKLFTAFEAIEDDIPEIINAAKNTNCIFDIDNFIDEFTSNLESSNVPIEIYNDGIESLILMLTLLCDSSGDSYYDIEPKQFNMSEPDNLDKYGLGNTYASLFNNLKNIVNTNEKYADYDLNLFSYDWRMSCADSAIALENYIDQMGYESVILMCHSMGGLVGSGYMARGMEQRNKVKQFVSLGTPYWGTPVAPTIMLTGEFEIFFNELVEGSATLVENTLHTLFTEVVVQYVLSNFPSIYELIPTANYVNATGGYLTYGEEDNALCTTYASTRDVIAEHMKGYKNNLMLSAEAFHNSLYIGEKHITEFTDRTLVYSNSKETLQWLTYDPELVGIYFKYTYSWNANGDKMVPTVSATMNIFDNNVVCCQNETHMGLVTIDFTSLIN